LFWREIGTLGGTVRDGDGGGERRERRGEERGEEGRRRKKSTKIISRLST